MTTFESERLFNPGLPHENRLPPRTSVVPALHEDVFFRNKEESEHITMLSGDFSFCHRETDDITGFEKADFDDSTWDTLAVPSMWQYHGYCLPVYPNVEYPIPFDPPYVGNFNPVGYYRKRFAARKGGRKILYFGGVDSAFFVYLNGAYVGFSKGSRMPAEFDVTELICDGENLLCVKVFTYSDGTYLENQDMLLASGIFRDVMLYNLEDISVWDYAVRTKGNRAYVNVTLEGEDFTDAELCGEVNGEKITLKAEKENAFCFTMDSPRLWNAEEPNTYTLTITLNRGGRLLEMHTKRFGFAEYAVVGNKLLLNGQQITVKGINRHEHDPKNGRAITVERIWQELKLIKAHNMNAIRCSHYPNHPAFYEIATELGIYVMDEADIETHGAQVTGDMGYFSKSPEWYPAYIDRVERMYERDKNETCISIWTIGNENGEGENIDRCVDYLRRRPVKKPVMHTGESHTDPTVGDFRLAGYFTMDTLMSYGEEGVPVIMLEYGHGMGNSPGLMEDTWDYVYTHRHICGGYVWEFKNHGFYAEDEEGDPFYQYGGDFGDINHWSNFSMDGYCLSDGTAKPAFRECKNVLAPTYVRYEGGKILLMNTNDFRSLEYVTVNWELLEDYKVLKRGEFRLPALQPYDTMALDIDTEPETVTPGARYFVNLKFFGEQGEEIALKQVELPAESGKRALAAEPFSPKITETADSITVIAEKFEAGFKNGLLCFCKKNGNVILNRPMKLNLYRAPTDNDGVTGWSERWISKWNECFYRYFEFLCHDVKVKKSENSVTVKAVGRWAPISRFVGFDLEITYKLYADGEILTELHGVPYGKFVETLPRIGVCFELEKTLRNVTWYGRGEDESYIDRKEHCPYGLYRKNAAEMNFLYDVPQECGSRCDTRFVSVTDGEKGLSVIGSEKFSFACQDFTQDALIAARHRNELKKSEKTWLYIDYAMRGLGSLSCGPDPEECYELRPHEFRFAFVLSGKTDPDALLQLAQTDFGVRTEKLSDTYVYEESKGRISVLECNVNT